MGFFNFSKIDVLNRYHDLDIPTNDPKIKGFFICFLVKPDLNLPDLDVFAKDPLQEHNIVAGVTYNDYDFNDQYRKIFRGSINREVRSNLVHDGLNYFSNIFTNLIESISYPDISSNSEDTLVTQDKNIFKLPVTETGTSGLTFNARLREIEGHDALRFISVWHKYIQAVTKGNLYPKFEYLTRNIIDYKASLYTLHLKPDLKTVTMFSKYTGIFPSNIPLSAMSESLEDVSDVVFDVEFTYDKFEWLNEDILRELNVLTSSNTIDYTTLSRTSAWDLLKDKRLFIHKIDKSPFYQIDLNGLQTRLRKDGCDISDTPASLFGAVIDEMDNSYLPAPTNASMVNLSTGNTLFSSGNANNNRGKIIEPKYDY